MDIEQIITRLASDDDRPAIDELQAAQTELTDAQEVLRDQIKSGSLPYAELRERKAEFDAITDALSKISEAHATAQAEIDAIIAEVDTETPVEDDDDDDDADEDEKEEAKVEPVAASIRPVGQTLARIKQTTPRTEVNETDLTTVSTSYTVLGRDRETVTPAEVGRAFVDTSRRFGGSKTTVLSIKNELAPERTLSGDASANERKMLDLFGANPVVPVTAAGGCCSIPEPVYDQPLLGSLARPIRDAFDVLNASRGAVQAYPPVCLPDEGADIWTCVQDEAVVEADPETWKSCVELACDTEEPTLVEPIYKCLTVGTFQERFAPEQWEAFVYQTDKLAARLAEARLFDWLVQSATSNYTGGDIQTGSTYANFIKTGIRLAQAIRQEQRLGDSQMVWVGPEMVYGAILEDSVTRRLNDADDIEILREHVNRVLGDYGITYVPSQDIADFSAFSYDGALPTYPALLPTVMLPAGAAKVLDGGEKNLGVDVVDFDLARQNKVGAFSEFWEGLLVRNCNVVFAEVSVEDCDTIACIV